MMKTINYRKENEPWNCIHKTSIQKHTLSNRALLHQFLKLNFLAYCCCNTNFACWCLISSTVLNHPICWNSASVALTVVSALQPLATSLFRGRTHALRRQILHSGKSKGMERTAAEITRFSLQRLTPWTFGNSLLTSILTSVLDVSVVLDTVLAILLWYVVLLYGAT